MLKADMPGLRGYSESNLKRMRTFYEEWRDLDADGLETVSSIKTDDLASDNNSPIKTGEVHPVESTSINILSFNFPTIDAFPANDFRCIGFTHHSEILAKCKSREERLFYISICAREHLTPRRCQELHQAGLICTARPTSQQLLAASPLRKFGQASHPCFQGSVYA